MCQHSTLINQLYHRFFLNKRLRGIEFRIYCAYHGKLPRFFNFFSTTQLAEVAANKLIGMTYLPALSVPNLRQQLVAIGYQGETLEALEQRAASSQFSAENCKTGAIVRIPSTFLRC